MSWMQEPSGIRFPAPCECETVFWGCACDELCAACRNICDGTGTASCRDFARRRRLMLAHLEVGLVAYVQAAAWMVVEVA